MDENAPVAEHGSPESNVGLQGKRGHAVPSLLARPPDIDCPVIDSSHHDDRAVRGTQGGHVAAGRRQLRSGTPGLAIP